MMVGRVFLLSVITFVLIIPEEAEGWLFCRTVNCQVGPWSSWSACSHKCGGGTQTRTRSKTVTESCHGRCWYPLTETVPCNTGCSNGGKPVSPGVCSCRAGVTGACCDACEEGKTVYNQCNDRCVCKDGKFDECTRLRKEFTTLTEEEQVNYVRAVKKISTDPTIKPAYDDLMYTHRILFPSAIHTPDFFLPWHRYFVLQYENLLRQADCTVNAIYWDWSAVSDNPWRAEPGDVWYSGERGLGGKGPCHAGEEEPCCVRNGVFEEGEWSNIPGSATVCLKRGFSFPPPNSSSVQALLKVTDFMKFEAAWRGMHNVVHCSIGGTMCSDDAASAPSFFFHHGFVDKFWGDWQDVSEANKNAHFSSVDKLMPRQGLYPKQLVDLKTQPGSFGPIRVEYVDNAAARRRSLSKGKS